MTDISSARRKFLALRDGTDGALLATLSPQNIPAASFAPLIWLDQNPYLFLSELASHTRNLRHCPELSLMLVEPESDASNAFARRRITLQGVTAEVARESAEFEQVLAKYHDRFGKVMSIIEPLPDFQLFRVSLREGRFVSGFGQAYTLTGSNLDELSRIEPGQGA